MAANIAAGEKVRMRGSRRRRFDESLAGRNACLGCLNRLRPVCFIVTLTQPSPCCAALARRGKFRRIFRFSESAGAENGVVQKADRRPMRLSLKSFHDFRERPGEGSELY